MGRNANSLAIFVTRPDILERLPEKFLASQKFKQDAKTAATLEKQESDGEVFVTSQALITVSKGN